MGVTAGPERILVTNGAAHGIFLALSCIIRSNDVVLCENLTDHGIIGLSNILGFSLKGLPTDEEGILPEALEAACAAGVSALWCSFPRLTTRPGMCRAQREGRPSPQLPSDTAFCHRGRGLPSDD